MTEFPTMILSHRPDDHRLRRDANYIGFMMLGMTAAMEFVFTALVYLLVYLGVLSQEQLSAHQFGLSNTAFLTLYACVYSFSMAVPPILVSLFCGRRHFPLSPSASVNAGDAFFGVLSSMGICMIANIVAGYIEYFFQSIGVQRPEMPNYLEPTVTSLLMNLIVFALLPALLEELVFRGYVLRALRPYGDWFAVTVSAVLFGLMHGNISQIPFALIVGMALGWVFVKTNNIWIAVSIHFANNAFSFLLSYFGDTLSETGRGKLNAFAIYAIALIGVVSLAALIVRRSVLLCGTRNKPRIPVRDRMLALLRAPAFVLCILVFTVLTIVRMI